MRLFLIHDAATEVAAAAFRLSEGSHGLGSAILQRAGYGSEPTTHDSYIVLVRLHDNFEAQRDPFEWRDATMRTAHLYLLEHFDEVPHGGTLEVEELRLRTTTGPGRGSVGLVDDAYGFGEG